MVHVARVRRVVQVRRAHVHEALPRRAVEVKAGAVRLQCRVPVFYVRFTEQIARFVC